MDKYKTWPYKHPLQRQSPPVIGDNSFKTNDRLEPFDASEKGPVKWIGKTLLSRIHTMGAHAVSIICYS